MFYVLLRIVMQFWKKIVMILHNMVFVPDGHESMPRVIVHNNNNCHSVSHFLYKPIVTSNMLTCINTLLGCYPKFSGNIRCWIDGYLSVYYVGQAALFTGLTIETTPSLWIIRMYLVYDCINCLQWCYMASKLHIAPLTPPHYRQAICNVLNHGWSPINIWSC